MLTQNLSQTSDSPCWTHANPWCPMTPYHEIRPPLARVREAWVALGGGAQAAQKICTSTWKNRVWKSRRTRETAHSSQDAGGSTLSLPPPAPEEHYASRGRKSIRQTKLSSLKGNPLMLESDLVRQPAEAG